MIRLASFFTLYKNTPANIAKKRLETIIAEDKLNKKITPNYLPQLKQDIIKAICKYTQIHSKTISLQFGKKNNNISILKLNIILKEKNKN